MAKKLYIGNLSYTTTNESLGEAFAQHGKVLSANVIMDKMSGRSRGFGFVEMENDEEALAAIDKMNGQDLDGRQLRVNEAQPLQPRAPRQGGFGGGRGGYHRE